MLLGKCPRRTDKGRKKEKRNEERKKQPDWVSQWGGNSLFSRPSTNDTFSII
jgi:hypothetical protein